MAKVLPTRLRQAHSLFGQNEFSFKVIFHRRIEISVNSLKTKTKEYFCALKITL